MSVPIAVTVDTNHTAVPRLAGFSFYEDAGAAAYVRLRRESVTGDIIAHIMFAADESATLSYGKGAEVYCGSGCYVEEVSGSVTGVLLIP